MSLSVDLSPLRESNGDVSARRVLDVVVLGERVSLVFVAEEVVSVFEGLSNLVALELDEEDGGEVEAEGLSTGGGILSDLDEGVVVGGDEEARSVEDLGVLEVGHVVLQVLERVVQSCSQVGAEGSLLLVDNNGASARLVLSGL